MDDVLDLVDAAASRFDLYRIDQVRAGTVELSKVLTLATMELSAAIHAMATSPHTVIPRVIEINHLENESDRPPGIVPSGMNRTTWLHPPEKDCSIEEQDDPPNRPSSPDMSLDKHPRLLPMSNRRCVRQTV